MTPTITKYSQGNEQTYILDAVKHIAHGRLLDIGAWHPTVFSNSRALIEMGWSGVLVEPSPEPLVNLLKEYGNNETVQLIAAVVGTGPGLSTVHISADAVSTTEECEYEKWKETATFMGNLIVPRVTLEQLFKMFGPFRFVNIDTEGTSVDLLKQMIFLIQHWQVPECICVEHNERREEVYLVAKDFYQIVHANETNLVLKAL